MNKLFNRIEWTGWCLFIVLIMPIVLLTMAEPTFDDEPQHNLPNWIALSWVGLTIFSILLIIVGNKLNKTHKTK
jgi:hypothetical protein